MLGTGNRITDRLTDRLHKTGDCEPATAGIDVDFQLDRQEQWVELVRRHGGKHPPPRRHLLGFFAVKDLKQRVALAGISPLVDHDLHRTVAFVDGARPVHAKRDAEPIESDIPEMSFLDLPSGCRLAKTVRRQCVELARATVSTVAAYEFIGAQAPFDHRHNGPPMMSFYPPDWRALMINPAGKYSTAEDDTLDLRLRGRKALSACGAKGWGEPVRCQGQPHGP